MKHGFIGFGNLAKAIYAGLKNDEGNSFCYTSNTNKHKEIEAVTQIEELVTVSDIIWICVKPKDTTEVLKKLSNIELNEKIIISPVAGTTIRFIEEYLGKNTVIVRIMPNLAIAYQKSVTAFCANKKSSYTENIKADLEKMGIVIELKEQDFDLFTAIFGSGPAFLLTILEVFRNKIKELDVREEIVDKLLLELLAGTITYFQENYKTEDIAKLVHNITSKGGTTETGLQYFENNNIGKLIENVILIAKDKANELKQ